MTPLPLSLCCLHRGLSQVDWVRYAAVHTMNVSAGPFRFVDWWMSYLNYQIEHHLFPSMPQFRHPIVSPRVKALFEKHGLKYVSSLAFCPFPRPPCFGGNTGAEKKFQRDLIPFTRTFLVPPFYRPATCVFFVFQVRPARLRDGHARHFRQPPQGNPLLQAPIQAPM